MSHWATLTRVALTAIVLLVILSPALLWILRIRKPHSSIPWFRALLGLLIVAAFVGFAGAHWHAPANDAMQLSVNFANVSDARVFGVALVILGIAFAITSVLELCWRQLTSVTRAAVVAADLFLIGVFLGITIATSGWAGSPLSKSYWSIVIIGLVLTPLVRALRPVEPATSERTPPATIPASQ